jgi:hypothetical protein
MYNMLIYMDCCCLNRPEDDQTQDKIRIESYVIKGILLGCFYGQWKLIGSDIVEYEIMKTSDLDRKIKALTLYSIRREKIYLNKDIKARALEIQKYGLKPLDSLHFASAEYRNVDVLLTVDRDFIVRSSRTGSNLRVANPISWYMEVIKNDK